jgi:hypothetical protein
MKSPKYHYVDTGEETSHEGKTELGTTEDGLTIDSSKASTKVRISPRLGYTSLLIFRLHVY